MMNSTWVRPLCCSCVPESFCFLYYPFYSSVQARVITLDIYVKSKLRFNPSGLLCPSASCLARCPAVFLSDGTAFCGCLGMLSCLGCLAQLLMRKSGPDAEGAGMSPLSLEDEVGVSPCCLFAAGGALSAACCCCCRLAAAKHDWHCQLLVTCVLCKLLAQVQSLLEQCRLSAHLLSSHFVPHLRQMHTAINSQSKKRAEERELHLVRAKLCCCPSFCAGPSEQAQHR
jgi:hypothetical protein